MARALVTGAAGFIGSHLTEALLDRGDQVVAVDAFNDSYDVSMKRANAASFVDRKGVTLVKGDLAHDRLEPLLDGVDVVYHQAGQPGVRLSWSDEFGVYLERNVLATQRLLEAVHATGNRARFVYASSSSIYGNAARFPTREDDLPAPHSPYGVTKLAAEHLCNLYAANFGLHTTSLRYFTVFGPRQRPDMSIHRLIEAARHGTAFPRYGDGNQVREFTYVGDIVAGNIAAAAADLPAGTVANLAGGGEITLNALIALVEDLTGTTIAIDAHAAQAGDSVRNGGAIERAYELFGWRPAVSLRDGIAAQIEWHRGATRLVAGGIRGS